MGRHIDHEASQISWIVFLKDRADKGLLEEAIRSFPGIRSIRFISKEEALETAQKDPVLSQGLTLTGRNPFPESFEVRWDPFFLRGDFLGNASRKVAALDGVEQVGYDEPRVERLALVQRLRGQLELVLVGVLWSAAALTVVLAGRLLFFPNGPFPARALALGVALGLAGGGVGAALSHRLVAGFSWRAVGSGAAVGLLLTLWQSAFRE